jgi:alpha-ketoglutarate-dependent taurine dioxygenase
MDEEEGGALIDELNRHATQPRFVYRHRWQPGDLILWDGYATLHAREAFDPSVRRILRRMDIAEPVPSGRDVSRVVA